MPRFIAAVLSVMLCCEPLQVVISADSSTGPLAASASREAARLAADMSADAAAHDWQVLQRISRGDRITVTTSSASFQGAFISADSTTVTVKHGVATERLKADDVLVVAVTRRRGSAGAAVAGTLGGIYLGSMLALFLAEHTHCAYPCSGVGLAVFSPMIAVPIAGGYGAWRLSTHTTEEIVYRRR
jgi:hypothetical protein